MKSFKDSEIETQECVSSLTLAAAFCSIRYQEPPDKILLFSQPDGGQIVFLLTDVDSSAN